MSHLEEEKVEYFKWTPNNKTTDELKSKSEVDNSNSTFWYFRIHTNIWAFFLVFPYYFKYDFEKQAYRLQKSAWHTGLCIITTAALAYRSFEELIKLKNLLSSVEHLAPFSYFLVAEFLSAEVYYLLIIFTIWRKSRAFFEVVEFLQQELEYTSRGHLSLKNKTLFFIWEAISSLGPLFLVLLTKFSESSWSLNKLFQKYYNEVLESFSLTPHVHATSSTFIYGCVVVCKILCEILYQLTTIWADWSVITGTMLLYGNVLEYTDLVRNPASSKAEIKFRYEHLKAFSKKIGNWLNLLIFGITMGSFPFFVSKFYEIVQPLNFGRFLISVYSVGTLMATLVLGAIIDRKARVTNEWLFNPKHYDSMSSNELQVLLSEVNSCEIGIHGLDLFKFTPGLLGSVISLLITFAVIMLQFKGSDN